MNPSSRPHLLHPIINQPSDEFFRSLNRDINRRLSRAKVSRDPRHEWAIVTTVEFYSNTCSELQTLYHLPSLTPLAYAEHCIHQSYGHSYEGFGGFEEDHTGTVMRFAEFMGQTIFQEEAADTWDNDIYESREVIITSCLGGRKEVIAGIVRRAIDDYGLDWEKNILAIVIDYCLPLEIIELGPDCVRGDVTWKCWCAEK